jgi:hypothetical protein
VKAIAKKDRVKPWRGEYYTPSAIRAICQRIERRHYSLECVFPCAQIAAHGNQTTS